MLTNVEFEAGKVFSPIEPLAVFSLFKSEILWRKFELKPPRFSGSSKNNVHRGVFV